MMEQMDGSYDNPFKFNAKELDEDTGLYYYGARYYNPRLSIWYGVDPLAELASNYSPYAYCFNNPIMFTDPTGMMGERKGGPGDGSDGKTIRTQDIEEVIIYGRRKVGGFLSRLWNGLKENWRQQYAPKTNADKYGGLNSYRSWQSNPNYNEEEGKYDRIARLIGNSHREEMLDFGGGGYNMFGGYGRAAKAVNAVEETSNLINVKNTAPQVGESFQNLGATISDGNISLSGRAVTNGRFDFVVTASGELKIGQGHFNLSGGAPEVQAAGQIRLFKGRVMEINNASGHYQPNAIQSQQFPTILSKMGIDVSRAKLRIYTPE